MYRIDTATKATDLFGPGKHGFRNGNVGTATPATKLDADFWNMIQETIARFVEGAGLALDKNNYDQLTAAFNAIIGNGGYARLSVENLWTKAQGSSPVPLVEASPIAVDLDLSNVFTLGLTASRTIGNCTNVQIGRPFVVLIQQPVGGNCGISYQSNWLFENDEAPSNSITPNAIDLLIGIGLAGGLVAGAMKQNFL